MGGSRGLAALIDEVRLARGRLVAAAAAVDSAQEGFRRGPGEWSVAEVVEHLVLAEQAGVNRIWQAAHGVRSGQPVWTGTPPHRGLEIDVVIERTWQLTGTGPISVRTAEKSPEVAAPRLGGPLAYWLACLEACQPVLERLARALDGLDLARVIFPHVTSGPLDAWQRVQFLRWHLDHHRQQIEDIKAAPGFPSPLR